MQERVDKLIGIVFDQVLSAISNPYDVEECRVSEDFDSTTIE